MEYALYFFFFNLIFGLQKYLNKKSNFSDGLIYKLGKKIIAIFCIYS